MARGTRDLPEGARRAGGVVADALLDQAPDGFDWIEIVRVRRHACDRSATRFDDDADLGRFVRGQMVEHDDVTAAQAWREAIADMTAYTVSHRRREFALRGSRLDGVRTGLRVTATEARSARPSVLHDVGDEILSPTGPCPRHSGSIVVWAGYVDPTVDCAYPSRISSQKRIDHAQAQP